MESDHSAYFATDVRELLVDLADDEMWEPLELPGQRWARFHLGSRDEMNAPVVWVIENPPGFTAPRHYHKMHRLEVVLKGSYFLDGRERGPGTITMFPAGQMYGPVVYGPEGGVAMEIFSNGADIRPVFESMPSDSVVANLSRLGLEPVLADSADRSRGAREAG